MRLEEQIADLKLNVAKQGFEGYFNLARKLRSIKIVERVSDDMLFLLTYMAAISTADIERDRIFDYAGSQKEYEASKYFRQIHILASKWGYSYSKACKYISQKLTDAYLSKLFGRMANILSSGEPEKNFLKQEKLTSRSAMENLDRETIGCLKPGVEDLNASLSMGLKSKLCWEKFIGETGSELINRCSRIFTDAVELGGDPTEIGNIVSSSSLSIVLLRMKRQLVSSGFRGLAITMHAVMIGLLIFIMEIISKFSGLVSKMSESHTSMGGMSMGMSMFNVAESLPTLYKFTFSVVLILTISNTLVVKIVEGGGNCKLFFYGGLMSGISGLCIILVPPIVSRVFTFQA